MLKGMTNQTKKNASGEAGKQHGDEVTPGRETWMSAYCAALQGLHDAFARERHLLGVPAVVAAAALDGDAALSDAAGRGRAFLVCYRAELRQEQGWVLQLHGGRNPAHQPVLYPLNGVAEPVSQRGGTAQLVYKGDILLGCFAHANIKHHV
jgi:hypothetical protein